MSSKNKGLKIVSIFLISLMLGWSTERLGHSQGRSRDSQEISYWNRAKDQREIENVYGGSLLRWIYGTPTGRFFDGFLFSQLFSSRVCGWYQSSSWSKSEIAPFVSKFNIQTKDFEAKEYSCFNDFFTRTYRPGVREFTSLAEDFPAFAEGRYFAYEEILSEQKFPIKGKDLSAAALLGSEEKAKPFFGGPLFLARLSPVDYHRFHFPDHGKIIENYAIEGKLHSVSPIALRQEDDIFLQNERQVTLLETENFGKLAYVEVGALCVGKIVQTHNGMSEYFRGEEKGMFLFGGSTVIVLGEKGKWKPDSDLVRHTIEGEETLVQLGSKIGSKQIF